MDLNSNSNNNKQLFKILLVNNNSNNNRYKTKSLLPNRKNRLENLLNPNNLSLLNNLNNKCSNKKKLNQYKVYPNNLSNSSSRIQDGEMTGVIVEIIHSSKIGDPNKIRGSEISRVPKLMLMLNLDSEEEEIGMISVLIMPLVNQVLEDLHSKAILKIIILVILEIGEKNTNCLNLIIYNFTENI